MVALSKVTTVEELMDEKYLADGNITLTEAISGLISKLGENMKVRRFTRYSAVNGVVQSYIHGGGRIGVLVELASAAQGPVVNELAKDICMQITAANPLFLNEDKVDHDALDKEREIYRVQALNEGKPEKIVEKMVEGRIKKYLKEVCLVDQVWVKNSDLTISKLLEEKAKEVGSPITIVSYSRFERGEGIEKVEENFAEEVQKTDATGEIVKKGEHWVFSFFKVI